MKTLKETYEEVMEAKSKQKKTKIKDGGNYLDLKTNSKGNLVVTLEKDVDKEEVQDLFDDQHDGAMYEMFEDIQANSSLQFFDSASDFGQMSDMSAITYDMGQSDNGDYEIEDYTYVFVYKDSYTKSIVEELLKGNEVVFTWFPIG